MQEHGVLVVDGEPIGIVQAGGLAVCGLPGGRHVVDGQLVGQVVPGDGVRHGVPGAGLGVVGAVEAIGGQGRVGGGVKGCKTQGSAQLLVGVISAQARPVVVGAVIEILALVVGQGAAHVHKAASGGLHGGAELIKIRVLVQQGRVGRYVLRVDVRCSRGQQYIHLAVVPLAERLHRRSILGQGALLAGEQPEGAGKHHVLPAQQDAAVLLFLQQGGLHHALQADPLVAAEYLILDVLGVGGKVAVQPLGRELRQGRTLAEGGILQLTVGPVRGDQIQCEQPHEEQGEHDQHRIVRQGSLFCMLVHGSHLPQKLKYRNGLLVLPTT